MPRSRATNSTPSACAVQVAVEVEDVGLDPALAHLEGRVGADRDRRDRRSAVSSERAAPLVQPDHPAGVDPVGGHRGPRLGAQVRGREAELAAALVAALDDAVDAVRAPERCGGGRHVAGLHAGAHVGRAERTVAPSAAG